MNICRYILLIIASLLAITCRGEADSSFISEDRIDEIIDAYYTINDISDDNVNEETFAILRENLEDIYNNKININDNKNLKENLESLQFLSSQQIESLCAYVYKYGPVSDINELLMVDGFYRQDVLNLMPFVSLGESDKVNNTNKHPLKNSFRYGKHEITMRGDNCPEATESNQYYAAFRYKFHYADRLFFGANAEKDVGEQFWGKKNKGFDSYHAYFQLNNENWLKRVILGDFNACFGHGLVINSLFSLGFYSDVNNMNTLYTGVHRSSSISEQNLLHGVASTLKFGDFDITAFYSVKNVDASLSDSSTFTSINTSGLHRTESQIENKGSVLMQLAGANLTYSHKNLHLGATAVCTWFDHKVVPADKLYTAFYFRGWNQFAASVDYSYIWRRLSFSGETAISDNNGVATLNSINFSPLSFLKLSVLQRYYSESYHSLLSSSVAQGGSVSNEQGLFIGAALSPLPGLRIAAYADFFAFPWAKYNVDKSSSGFNSFARIDFFPSTRFSASLRFRIKRAERNLPQSYFPSIPTTSFVDHFNRLSIRADVSASWLNGRLQLKPSTEITRFSYDSQSPSWGYSVRTDFNYSLKSLPVSFKSRLAYFYVPDYDCRIYSSEADVLYAFTSALYYGHGIRYYICTKISVNKFITLYFKVGQFRYFAARQLSYGSESLSASHRSDFHLLLRLCL